MNTNSKRSLMQILRDLFEDEVYAFAMSYAKGDVEKVNALESKLR